MSTVKSKISQPSQPQTKPISVILTGERYCETGQKWTIKLARGRQSVSLPEMDDDAGSDLIPQLAEGIARIIGGKLVRRDKASRA